MRLRGCLRFYFIPIAFASLLLPAFYGCNGGTSTDVGNPSLSFDLENEKGERVNNADFATAFIASDAEPRLLCANCPDASNNSLAGVFEGGKPGTIKFDLKKIQILVQDHSPIALGKGSASAASFPMFNLMIAYPDNRGALILGLHHREDENFFRDITENRAPDVLVLNPLKTHTGSIDTTGLKEPPCMVFIPGTWFYAPVVGTIFTLKNIPNFDSLPMRLVGQSGAIYSVKENFDPKHGSVYTPSKIIGNIQPESGFYFSNLAEPAILPLDSTFKDSLVLDFRTIEPGSAIRFSLDGRNPDSTSSWLRGRIVIRETTKVKAIATKLGFLPSKIAERSFIRLGSSSLPSPTIEPKMDDFDSTVILTIFSSLPGTTIRYTLNGKEPDSSSTIYKNGILIIQSSIVRARSFGANYTPGKVTTRFFQKAGDTPPAPPRFQPPDDLTFGDSLVVSLVAENGVDIYYSFDGAEPDLDGNKYDKPFLIKNSAVIKAVAISNGLKSRTVQRSYAKRN